MTYRLSLVVDFTFEKKNVFSKMVVIVHESTNRVTRCNLLDWVHDVLDIIHTKTGFASIGEQTRIRTRALNLRAVKCVQDLPAVVI